MRNLEGLVTLGLDHSNLQVLSEFHIQLPALFLAQMREQLGQEFSAFLEALSDIPPTSIHYNTFKSFKRKESYNGVKWYSNGTYLPERPTFTLDPAFHAGAYYVQEASSMVVAEAARQLIDLDKAVKVMDLCAAPGGKTTLLASLISEDSLLLANEVIRSRYQVLDYNLTKWGTANKVTTSQSVDQFGNIKNFFDLILVDAPCSGEGLFRKDPQAIAEWSPENVAHCSVRQKKILKDTVDLLKPGGILLYSTCTYNDRENQENAAWLEKEFPLETAPLQLSPDWGITAKDIGYQCYPHRVKGEGFYIATFRKLGESQKSKKNKAVNKFRHYQMLPKSRQQAMHDFIRPDADLIFLESEKGQIIALPTAIHQDLLRLSPNLRYFRMGIPVGRFKGKDLIPDPALALSTLIHPELPRIEVEQEDAIKFLRKEIPGVIAKVGWQLICYNGLPLGWVKGLKNRINNYYPKEWRIRMGNR